MDWMPPLPEPFDNSRHYWINDEVTHVNVFTADQMRQAQADAARAALQEAAKICEETADNAIDDYEAGAAYYCGAHIRALMKEIA